MDSAWLEDFLALVDGGHFSRAAEQRGITQPAFSRRVRALEDWVGSPLFDRESQPVTLTPAGIRFRPVAEETLRRLYQGREAAREAGRAAAETLRFASTQALSLTFFPRWLQALEARESFSATVHLTAAHMAACEQVMLRGEAQFLLCHHHPAAASFLMSDQFHNLPVGADRLLPVSAPEAGGTAPLFSLSAPSDTPVPLLSFSGESGIGRILAATRAVEEMRRAAQPELHLASRLGAGGHGPGGPGSRLGADEPGGRRPRPRHPGTGGAGGAGRRHRDPALPGSSPPEPAGRAPLGGVGARARPGRGDGVRDQGSGGALAQDHVAPEQELLGTLAGVDLGGEDVAVAVHREVVDPVEVARHAAVAAEGAEHLAGVAASGCGPRCWPRPR